MRQREFCLFLFQVLARIANATRPTIHLCEIVNEAQLERLLLLLVGTDFNRGDISWGGAWAQYSLTCMLQDILAGLLKIIFYLWKMLWLPAVGTVKE